MLEEIALPSELTLVRTTPEFGADDVPPALLSSHHVAPGVWGVLAVAAGSVVFVVEGSGESRTLTAGTSQVIEPEVIHHIEPSADARFQIEFHRRDAE